MSGELKHLCTVAHKACHALTPMVLQMYECMVAMEKADKSIFTIADGMVQHLLVNHLFQETGIFKAIVGEEDADVSVSSVPYTVANLTVPEEFVSTITTARDTLTQLSTELKGYNYQDITVFIDPIDGTREFSTKLGEQCSICIGFAKEGKAVAGLVYRPITAPPTYAMGAASENFFVAELNEVPVEQRTGRGLLTSNGSISPFIVELLKNLNYERVPSGGAGNKMLMLLEGKGIAYIQDRGVSRWDTCAAEAVITAQGGLLAKLLPVVNGAAEHEFYTYEKTENNADFVADIATLTPYNARSKSLVKKDDPPRKGTIEEFAPYSNLVGLYALSSEGRAKDAEIRAAIAAVHAIQAASFD